MPVLRNDIVSLWNTLLGLCNYYMPHCMWAQKKPFSGECCLWILRFVDAFSKLFRLPKCSAHQHFLWKCHLKMSSDANNLNPDSESLCVCELSFMHGKEMRAWVLLPHPVIQGHPETSWLVPLSARFKKKKKDVVKQETLHTALNIQEKPVWGKAILCENPWSVANFYNWMYVLKKMHRNKTVILVRQKVSQTQYYVSGDTVNAKEKV